MRDHRLSISARERATGLAVAAAISCLLAAGSARADDSVFDFVAPRLDQTGDYQVGSGALLENGQGTLAAAPDWFDDDWRYRFLMTVDNPGQVALTEWPLRLVIDAATMAGYDVFELARANGGDLRITRAGTAITRVSFGHWDLAQNIGSVWFQVADLPPGQSEFELYFGYNNAPLVDDPETVFSYSSPYASRYALEPAGADMTVTSSVDGNQVVSGAYSGTLGSGELAVLDMGMWTTGQSIEATGPIEVGFAQDTAAEGAPMAFASRLHSVVVSRGADNTFTMIAPLADADVDVSINGAFIETRSLVAGVVDVYVQNLAAADVIRFDATTPILVAHRSSDNNDGYVLPPPASELWGFRSGTPRILAVDTQVDVTWYDSDGSQGTVTIAAGQYAALTAGSTGSAQAMRMVATESGTGQPGLITVVANADGDGGDGIVFHRESDLGRRWVVPNDARYATISLTDAGATCVMTPPDGSPEVAMTSDPALVPPYPSRVQFGNDTGINVLAGAVIECDTHGVAYFEDAATDDERNLYSMEAHRKTAVDDPVVSLVNVLDTRYQAGAEALIETPDALVPTATLEWTDFRVATSEPPGTSITYQISVDGGSTWLVASGGDWVQVIDPTIGSDSAAIFESLPNLDAASGRLRVRAILISDDGVARPSIDAIRVFYTATDPAIRLAWDPIEVPSIAAGAVFPVALRAVNVDGVTINGYTGEVVITASHGGIVTPNRVTVADGRTAFEIAVSDVGDGVLLTAESGDGLIGVSDPIDLVSLDGFTVEEYSGNNQFGVEGTELGEPLAVRVIGPNGAPAGRVQVVFRVTEGGGLFEPEGVDITGAITDDEGVARMRLRLGSAGAQRIEAAAFTSSIELVARADPPTGMPPVVDDGCCASGRSTPTPGTWLLLLVVLGLCRTRRRRGLCAR